MSRANPTTLSLLIGTENDVRNFFLLYTGYNYYYMPVYSTVKTDDREVLRR